MNQHQLKPPQVSIVIPTLNEAENIYPLLTRIFDMQKMADVSLEVVIVDDSSTDGTREKVRTWETEYPVTLICRETKEGLAGAVIEGARAARGEVVVVMDADLSHPPEIVPQLIGPVLENTHDMVIGSRYTKGGSTPDWPVSRKIASKLATLPARILTDPRDPLAGFFAVKRQYLADLDKAVSGFKIGLEVLVAGKGKLRVAEVPIAFYDRYRGKSKMNRNIIFEYFHQVLGLCGARLAPSFAIGLWAGLCIGGLADLIVFFLLYLNGISISTAHMASFLVACVATTVIHCHWTFPQKKVHLKEIGGVIVIIMLAMVLRGGILGDLLSLGCPLALSMLLVSLTSNLLIVLGLMFFVFTDGRQSKDVSQRIFCWGVVIFALVLRLVYLGLPALLEEEAYYWNYGNHPAMGYLDHPPMVAILNHIGTLIFGTHEFGVRIGAVICWLITAGFCYSLTRSLYDRLAAFRAVMLLSVLPFFFAVGMIMTPDAPLTACWSAVIYFLYRVFLLAKPRAWLGVGIFLGLGMFSKYTLALLGPAILLFMLIDPKSRRWFISPWPYLAVVIALIIFSPDIIWNVQHHWVSFLFQSERRVEGVREFATVRLLWQIVLLLTPLGVIGFIAFLFKGRSLMAKRSFLFFLLIIAAPLAVFLFFSLSKGVKLNWTGPLWLGLIPILAAFMAMEKGSFLNDLCRRWWQPTAVAMLVIYGLALHYYSLGLPGVATFRHPFLSGWDGLARQIEKIVDKDQKKDGKRPVVVGMDKYQIASGLAFYRYKNEIASGQKGSAHAIAETTAWNIFGWNGLMYDYWFPPTSLDGRDLLLVASSKEDIADRVFASYVRKIGPVREVNVTMNGYAIDQYYVRLVRGYHHE